MPKTRWAAANAFWIFPVVRVMRLIGLEILTAYAKKATRDPAVVSPLITLCPPYQRIRVTPNAATNSIVGVSVAIYLAFFRFAPRFSLFSFSNRSISYCSLTKDFTTRAELTASCKTDVISAVDSWIIPPELRIFLPKKFMKKSTTGNVRIVKTVSFQSR